MTDDIKEIVWIVDFFFKIFLLIAWEFYTMYLDNIYSQLLPLADPSLHPDLSNFVSTFI